jgi:sugar/nucleoside kinase (ribokinase family)
MKTLVVGQVTHDLYEGDYVAGGCAFYGAHVHRRMDGETHLVTVVGEDFRCDEAIDDIEATLVRRGETTVFANYYPSGRLRQQLLLAQAPKVTPEMAPPQWLEADLVHLAPVLGEVDLQAWKEAVGDGLLAINVQGWVKEKGSAVDAETLESYQNRGVTGSAYRVRQKSWDISAPELTGVDVACLSEEDLAGQRRLLPRLVDAIPVVALTLGERGSRIFVDGKERARIGIYPTEAVDPTGAGDVFAASFVHRLADGDDPIEAARFGAAAASVIVEGRGPEALDRLNQIQKRMNTISASIV